MADGNCPNGNGQQWFQPIRVFINFLMSLFSGTKVWFADVAITAALPACTYANGTSGVGATLTANASAAFPSRDGIAPLKGQTYLIVGQAARAQNGWYKLTTVGDSSTAWVLTRVTDFDAAAEMVPGMAFGVRMGTLWAGATFTYAGAATPTVGTTALIFTVKPKTARYCGCIPSARLPASVNPTANDIAITIGGIQFKVVATLGAAAAFVQVLREATAAATYANIVSAINGDAATAGTKWLEATTPFAASVFADMVTATVLRLRLALGRGDLPAPGVSPSIALLAAVTAGAAAWTLANLNEIGDADINMGQAAAKATITTAQITAGEIEFEFPFTPTKFIVQARTATGGQRLTALDLFTISGDAIKVAFHADVAPDLQNTDVLTVCAWQ